MEKSVKSIVVPYGVYIGIALSFITVLAYAFSLELFTKWWLGVINLVLLLLLAIFAVRKAKKLNTSNYFSFKNAFTAYFIPVALGMFISTLVTIIIFNVIDPDAAQVVTNKTMETARQMMENFGTPKESIQKAMRDMQQNNQFSILNQLKNYVYILAFYSVIGLIIALIFKEKDPAKA